MVVHICYPSTWVAEQEDHKFENSLGCIARPCLKKKIQIVQDYFELKSESHILQSPSLSLPVIA
jgi:hypothetical protein